MWRERCGAPGLDEVGSWHQGQARSGETANLREAIVVVFADDHSNRRRIGGVDTLDALHTLSLPEDGTVISAYGWRALTFTRVTRTVTRGGGRRVDEGH